MFYARRFKGNAGSTLLKFNHFEVRANPFLGECQINRGACQAKPGRCAKNRGAGKANRGLCNLALAVRELNRGACQFRPGACQSNRGACEMTISACQSCLGCVRVDPLERVKPALAVSKVIY